MPFRYSRRYNSGALFLRLCKAVAKNFCSFEKAQEVKEFFKKVFLSRIRDLSWISSQLFECMCGIITKCYYIECPHFSIHSPDQNEQFDRSLQWSNQMHLGSTETLIISEHSSNREKVIEAPDAFLWIYCETYTIFANIHMTYKHDLDTTATIYIYIRLINDWLCLFWALFPCCPSRCTDNTCAQIGGIDRNLLFSFLLYSCSFFL